MNRVMNRTTVGAIEAAFASAGIDGLPPSALDQFHAYLELLLRWNQKLNLTAARQPEEIIQRHLVECAFAAQHLPGNIRTLLDFGSGAGLPGIPLAICCPQIHVTLAEAQGKKASFLREACRVLGISGEVCDGRVEIMPESRLFDAVSIRAVEKMEFAIPSAVRRAQGYLLLFATLLSVVEFHELAPELRWLDPIALPNAEQRILAIGQKV
jgi:16S rRNA (guanine527-N7)-methyltransferase